LVGAVDASQVFASHVAAMSFCPSASHDDTPLTVKPTLHVGWQVASAAKLLEQSPIPPLAGAVDASQVLAWHVAAVSVDPSALHDDLPLTV
jgi:hypothetical protein